MSNSVNLFELIGVRPTIIS